MPIAPNQAGDPVQVLALVDDLENAGRFRDAAIVLERLPRSERDPMVDVRIVRLRHQAFAEIADETPSEPGPDGAAVDIFRGTIGPPEVHRRDLDPHVLHSAIRHHGCLIVRGLIPNDTCGPLRADIDDAFTGFDDRGMFRPVEDTAPWFARFDIDPAFEPPDPLGTAFLRKAGGVYAPFAPRAFVEYRNALADAGLIDVVHQHLGATPVLSVNKFVLRRISGGAEPAWHQDGLYLGVDTRAVNLWVALSDCGADTPLMGLEMLPGRREGLAVAGTHNAPDPRAVSQEIVDELSAESRRPVVRPFFGAGDGILFDQFFIHRSDVRPLEIERYAVESWFFVAHGYPPHLVPVVAE